MYICVYVHINIYMYVCTYVCCICTYLCMYILDVLYRIAEKFRRRIFCNFTLKQTFRGIKFTICVLIVCVCAFILMISRINFRELDQITKNTKF